MIVIPWNITACDRKEYKEHEKREARADQNTSHILFLYMSPEISRPLRLHGAYYTCAYGVFLKKMFIISTNTL